MDNYYLILDIGGTKTTAVVFDPDGTPVTDFLVRPSRTYEGENAVFENTVELACETLKSGGIRKEDLLHIGVAAPGPLDYKTGTILNVPLMGWRDFPLGTLLANEFGCPVNVENDGNLGALAEATLGVAKGENVVLYQTISTGCGGGIAIGGNIFHGRHGFAGEFGHVSINPEGPACGCGANGCFELYASGTAVNARLRRDLKSGLRSRAFELANYEPERLNGAHLSQAASEGDGYAIRTLQQEGRYIGTGLANLINLFDPDAIVLAGGMVKASAYFWDAMMEQVRRNACFEVEENLIRISQLNDRTVAYGAFVMAQKAHQAAL